MRRAGLLLLFSTLAACSSWTVSPAFRRASSAPSASVEPTTSFAAEPEAPFLSPAVTAGSFDIEIIGSARIPFADRFMQVEIIGRPGIVVAWRAATDRERARIAWRSDYTIGLARLDERNLVLGWIGTVCDLEATLTIETGSLVVTPAPRKGCDALGAGRGLVLTYAVSADPRGIDVTLGERVLLPEP